MIRGVWKHRTVLHTHFSEPQLNRLAVGPLGASRSCQTDGKILARGFLCHSEEGRTDHIMVKGSKAEYQKDPGQGLTCKDTSQAHTSSHISLPPIMPSSIINQGVNQSIRSEPSQSNCFWKLIPDKTRTRFTKPPMPFSVLPGSQSRLTITSGDPREEGDRRSSALGDKHT